MGILFFCLAVVAFAGGAYFAGCERGFGVAKRNRGPDGRLLAEPEAERRFGETSRQRADYLFYAALACVLAGLLFGCSR